MIKQVVVPMTEQLVEHSGKTYIDPETAQIIIEHIAELRKKLIDAEEQLEIMELLLE